MDYIQDGLAIPWATPCLLCKQPIQHPDEWTFLISRFLGVYPVHDACVGSDYADRGISMDDCA